MDNLTQWGKRIGVGLLFAAALLVILLVLLKRGTGDTEALFNLFYIPVLIGAMFMGERGGILLAIGATIAVIILTITGHTQLYIMPEWLTLSLRGALFLIVAFLAGRLATRVRENAREWQSLLEISSAINSSLDLEETLQAITKKSVELTSADACAIRLVQEGSDELIYANSWGLSERYLHKGPLLVSDSPLVRRSLEGEEVIIADVKNGTDLQYREEMLDEGIVSIMSLPLRVNERVIGLLNLYRKATTGFSGRDRRVGRAFAEQAAIAIQNARLFKSIRQNYLETVRALTRAIEAKDPITLGHSERVTEHALLLAKALRLAPNDIQSIEFGAILHDIGKIGLDEATLAKSGPFLSMDEQMLMEMHPMIGKSIVEPIQFLHPCLPIIFSHHECWDGSGYPEGLAETEIPLLARIVAVADALDHRMYQASPFPISTAEALEELEKVSATRLDPKLVDVMVKIMTPSAEISLEAPIDDAPVK